MTEKQKIELLVDIREQKSVPILRDSGLFEITMTSLAVGDLIIDISRSMFYVIEIKIGNDIKDLERTKQEISNMHLYMENPKVHAHLIFIEEGYTPRELEDPWIINSECQKAGVFFHRRKVFSSLPSLVKKIADGQYTQARLHVKTPPKIIHSGDKTHRALPFVARVLALVDGITVEMALDLYEEIKKRAEKTPGIQDMFREIVLNTIDEFPTWIDFKIGEWEEKEKKIDTDKKRENFMKLTTTQKIKKYRAAIVKRLIAALTATAPDQEEEDHAA
mgnify:CR=1 FL=1